MTRHLLKRAFGWAVLALAMIAAPVAAQSLLTTPAEKIQTSPGGVDLRTGAYNYHETDLSIGGEGGLALTRTMIQAMPGHSNPFATFSHNWDILIQELRVDTNDPTRSGGGYRMLVQYGGRSRTFDAYITAYGSTYNNLTTGPRALLTFSGTLSSSSVVYTYTASDGTVVVFRQLGGGDCLTSRCAYASEVTDPDGTHYTLSYTSSGVSGGDAVRLQSVVSSRGYALLLEGSGHEITKACVLNLAVTTLPSSGVCPSGAQATSTYTYTSGNVGLATATGPDGATSSFSYTWTSGRPASIAFTRPGESTPWLTNTISAPFETPSYAPYSVSAQTFADGQTYTYAIQYGPMHHGTEVPSLGGGYTDGSGRTVTAAYDWIVRPGYNQPGEPCNQFPCSNEAPIDESGPDARTVYQQTPGPVSITQPLGRTTTFDYCDPVAEAGLPSELNHRCFVDRLYSFTEPDGSKTDLVYDGVGNITQVTRHARPGSTQIGGSAWSNIVTSATFDTTHIRSQNKPLTMTDANGHTTNYTYSTDHGGLLTETGPAPSSGAARPETRHSYTQLYAWISNGSGGYVQAATPIWLRTATSTCRTSAASTTGSYVPCSAAGDEVLTQYDYGTGDSSHGNTLLLRGQTVTSTDGGTTTTLRTCYGYDALGRRISETRPNANLTSCP